MKRPLRIWAALVALLAGGCASHPVQPPPMTFDEIAEGYVRAVLAVGEHDPNEVDAYYGPAQWREQAHKEQRSLIALRNIITRLYQNAETAPADPKVPAALFELRRRNLKDLIAALDARVRMLQGWKPSFDDESLALYDIAAPHYKEDDFKPMLATLDKLLPPGPGSVSERYNRYTEQFAIPADRIEPVMKIATEAARARTLHWFKLPNGEHFDLELVHDQPWSAYNWYQGKAVSRIEINTDQPITISRAIELASHEGYPGHHVYNSLLEDQLLKGRHWQEFSIYALFSPQSFIAEGSADYGVDLAFPPAARHELTRKLFEAAGFDPDQAATYNAIVDAAQPAGAATLEAARRYRDGQATAEQTLQWLQTYSLATPSRAQQRLRFFDRYGAYIINYSYGKQVVAQAIDRSAGKDATEAERWRWFFTLLSTPRTPQSLLKDGLADQTEAPPAAAVPSTP
ncbi:hypothetical protein [Solimonas marina]|uniref:DUF885 domain-containing protein n=1 Tax=Solimonas marina TaxID=2714601 RepID=A0A969WBJ1_9GAMM|nr:hypothetical protein [Solimonas marina]NKF23149.1 hypothetical protein [Solimonas marina]